MIGLNLKIAALAIFLALGGFVWWRIDSLSADNKEYVNTIQQMEQDIAVLNSNIQVMKDQEILRKNAEMAADAARILLKNLTEKYNEIVDGINNATPEEDGSIAPVLRRALDGVGGVQPTGAGR